MQMRVFKGFVIAAKTPIIVASIAAMGYVAARSVGSGGTGVIAIIFAILLAAPVSFATTVLIGVPAYYLAIRFRLTSLPFYLIVGGLISLVAFSFLLFNYYGVPYNVAPTDLDYIILIASLISGPLATRAFWLFVRPDRINERSSTQDQ